MDAWHTIASSLINNIILLFVILSFASLCGYFCERIGIVNIAIDGQMIWGALIYSIFGMLFNQWLPNSGGMLFLLPVLFSMIFSVVLSGIFGFLTIKLKCNHIIAGTAINVLIAGIATFLTKPLGQAISQGRLQKLTSTFVPSMQIANGSLFGETLIILAIAIVVIVAISIFISKSRFGLRFKAVGDNPNAVDAQGINVHKLQWTGVLISGVMAAIAGSIFIYGGLEIGNSSNYFEGNVSGIGFLAMAIVVSGSWKIPLITIVSIIFATLKCVFQNDQILVDTGIQKALGTYSKYFGKAIPFIFSFATLILFSYKGNAPKYLGQHFDKTKR